MKCKQCNCDMKKCISLWKDQRKCCPDCKCSRAELECYELHIKALDEMYSYTKEEINEFIFNCEFYGD